MITPTIILELKKKHPQAYNDAKFLIDHRIKLPRPPARGAGYLKRLAAWRESITQRADEMFELIVERAERAEANWFNLLKQDVTPRQHLRGR